MAERVEGRPDVKVLLEEACRIADRLDQLDELLRGDADRWCTLVASLFSGTVYVLKIDGALMEARQQANTLRQLVATIDELAPKEPTDDGDDDSWASNTADLSA